MKKWIEKVKPKGKFIPKINEEYYYVDDFGGICSTTYDDFDYESYLINHKFVFREYEEAYDYKWYLDQLDKYKRTFKKEEVNYCFYFDVDYKRLEIDYNHRFKYDLSYFGDGKNIEEFRRVVGDERIKKYMFNIWE